MRDVKQAAGQYFASELIAVTTVSQNPGGRREPPSSGHGRLLAARGLPPVKGT